MKTKAEIALDAFERKFNCAQAVLLAYCNDFGLSEEYAKKVAGAFGGGMGHIDGVCGAVSGALMAIGLKYGKVDENDDAARQISYKKAREFAGKFKEEFHSIHCTELISFNLSAPEEAKKAKEAGAIRGRCPNLVKRATEIVGEIL